MKVRAYQTTDYSALNELKQRCFESGMERMRLDFWDWQFVQNPAGKGSGAVAVEDDEIIGFMGFVPKRLKVGERIVVGAQLLDLMIVPKIRGGYLAALVVRRAMSTAQEAGFAFIFGLPNQNSLGLALNKRIGLQLVFSPSVWVKPLQGFAVPTLMRRLGIPRAATRLMTGCAALFSSCFRSPRVPTGITVEATQVIDERFDQLWSHVCQAQPVLFVRDAEYLNWRYLHHPVYKYHIVSAIAHGRLVAYVVLCERPFEGLQVGQIVDWLVEPSESQAVPWLLGAAQEWARTAGLAMLTVAALPSMSGVRSLRRLGYFLVPKRFEPVTTNLVALCSDQTLSGYFQDFTQWFWTWGDTDVV